MNGHRWEDFVALPTQQAPLGSQIQAGPGKFVCDGTEADGATAPPAFPPKLQGNFVKYVLFPENPNSSWNSQEAVSTLPSNLPLKSFALESEPLGRLNLPPFCPPPIVLWVGILERDSSIPGTSPAVKAVARTSMKRQQVELSFYRV